MTEGAPVVAGLGGVLLFLAAGSGLVELLPAMRERTRLARLGFSYLLGVAAVAGSTYLLGIAFDVRITRSVVLAPAVLLVVAAIFSRALRHGPPAPAPPNPSRAGALASRFAFGISAFIAICLFAAALTKFNVGFDGEMSWCAAARWVRADRSVTPRALVDSRIYVSHPQYPILMPLAQVAVQETFGSGDDRRAIKPFYAGFFPALLLVFFDLARRHAGTLGAAFAAVALASVPVLTFTDFGGADTAYSDVPLAAFFGSGLLLLLLGRARRSESLAAAVLLGAAVLTKNEGLPFAVVALVANVVYAFFRHPAERRRRLEGVALAGTAVLFAGLALWTWQRRIPDRFDESYGDRLGTVSLASEASARLPAMARAAREELGSRKFLAGFPLAAAVILVAGAAGLRRRIVPPILLSLFLCFGAYVLALLVSPWEGALQVHPTWDRFLLQVSLPFSVLLALGLRTGWRAVIAAWMGV